MEQPNLYSWRRIIVSLLRALVYVSWSKFETYHSITKGAYFKLGKSAAHLYIDALSYKYKFIVKSTKLIVSTFTLQSQHLLRYHWRSNDAFQTNCVPFKGCSLQEESNGISITHPRFLSSCYKIPKRRVPVASHRSQTNETGHKRLPICAKREANGRLTKWVRVRWKSSAKLAP